MNKLYTFSLFAFLGASAVTAVAQPSLSAANTNPIAGESFVINTAPYMAPGAGGANVTWNFSTLTSSGTNTFSYVSSSSTPNGASFPNANIAYTVSGMTDYYSATGSTYARAGAYGNNTAISYSDVEQLLSYPFTYNSTFVDSFKSTYTSNGITLQRLGKITATADGYGTLVLPNGTVTNVLRVKWEEDYGDYYSGFAMYEYETTIYAWYKPGVHYPIMSMTELVVNQGAANRYGSYMDVSGLGAFENSVAGNLLVYPNPSNSLLNIDLSLQTGANVKISVINMLGESFIYSEQTAGAGNFYKTLDVSGLAAGMYILQLDIEGTRMIRKITIE